MDDLLLRAISELNDVRRRLDDLSTREYVTSPLGLISANWIDAPLLDTVNGNHFNDNSTTLPSGWTQVVGAALNRTNDPVGFWMLAGSSFGAWKFRRQSPFTVESLTSNAAKSFWIGPILLRDSALSSDLTYHFGIYRNSGGVIDENTYIRAELNWDATTSVWRVRGERKDGTTVTSGAYTTLGRFPVAPLWFRLVASNTTNKFVQVLVSGIKQAELRLELMATDIGSGVTWGQVWWQFHLVRGAGNPDLVAIGGIDYSNHV